MGFLDKRKAQKEAAQTQDRHEFAWERNIIPELQDGFESPLSSCPTKSVLHISFYFADGAYQSLIRDRENKLKAFLEVGTLKDCWETIEKAIVEDSLKWSDDRAYFNPRNGM